MLELLSDLELLEILKTHRRMGTYKHSYAPHAEVRCRCGWNLARAPQLPGTFDEPDLLDQLRADHELHVVQEIRKAEQKRIQQRLSEIQSESSGSSDARSQSSLYVTSGLFQQQESHWPDSVGKRIVMNKPSRKKRRKKK